MKLFLTVPHEGYKRDEIDQFERAAQRAFRARGWTLVYRPVIDRPTMACRNRQIAEFRRTPCDLMLTMDYDCLPTTLNGRPDIDGLLILIEDLQRPDIDVVGGWTLIHMEHKDPPLVPCVVNAKGSDPARPDVWPFEFVKPYADEPQEITGGGLGAHCLALTREVADAMHASGRLPFDDVHDRDPDSPTWGGRTTGHDLAFCQLAQDLGFRVWLEPRVFWGHRKDVDLRWIHEIVRDQARRLDSHAALARALATETEYDAGEVPAWTLLRMAEEAARCGGLVAACGVYEILMNAVEPGRVHAGEIDGPTGPVSLLVLLLDEDFSDVELASGCVVIVADRQNPNLTQVMEGQHVVNVEHVEDGAVIRCV